MRLLRKLFIFVLVLLALVGVGDWLLTTWAEGAMERHLRKDVGGRAHVEIDSWPVMTRAVLSETIDEMTVEVREATVEGVNIDFVQIELRGISVDRKKIFKRQIDGVDIRNGTATVAISKENLAAAAEVPVESLSTEGAELLVQDGRLLVAGQDVGAFPRDVLPCSATGEVTEDAVQLTCELDGVPEIVTRNLPR